MSFVTFVSVALGYVAGIVAVFFVGGRIVRAMLRGVPLAGQRKTIVKGAAAGGFVALLPALILGTVVGGTLGAASGEALSKALGAGRTGAVGGIALGTFAVTTLVMCIAILLGAWLGRAIARRSDDES